MFTGDEQLVNLAHLAAELVGPEGDQQCIADHLFVNL
jgi:hypothetical protein